MELVSDQHGTILMEMMKLEIFNDLLISGCIQNGNLSVNRVLCG